MDNMNWLAECNKMTNAYILIKIHGKEVKSALFWQHFQLLKFKIQTCNFLVDPPASRFNSVVYHIT